MNSKKITDSEIASLKVASLPTRPNAETKYGGLSYSATKMKEAFDKLPLFIIQRLNLLIDDINRESGGVCDNIKTGLSEGHTLKVFFSDVKNGKLGAYFVINGTSLTEHLERIYSKLERLERGPEGIS